MKRAIAMTVAFACGLVAAPAAAEITKSQCIDANTYGQTLRREGKLSAAEGQFKTCNDVKCPEVVRADCMQRLEEIDAAFPSILFDVKDSASNDLVDVTVMVDGKLVTEKMTGTPLRVDPGSHEFKFEVAGEKALIRTFVLKEGEKLRRERILFVGDAPPPKPVTAAPAEPVKKESSSTASLQRYGGIGLAGVGVIAIGAGVLYGVKAMGKASDQEENCKSVADCRNYPQAVSDHDGAEVWGRFSTIGFIAGSILLASGAVLFFTAPKSDSAALKRVLPLAQAATTGWAF